MYVCESACTIVKSMYVSKNGENLESYDTYDSSRCDLVRDVQFYNSTIVIYGIAQYYCKLELYDCKLE